MLRRRGSPGTVAAAAKQAAPHPAERSATDAFSAGRVASHANVRVCARACALPFAAAVPGAGDTGRLLQCARAAENSVLQLRCPAGMVISKVVYASYGLVPDTEAEATPAACSGDGTTDGRTRAHAHSPTAASLIESLCANKGSCAVFVSDLMFPLAASECPPLQFCASVYATAGVACRIGPDFAVDPNFAAWSKPKYSAARIALWCTGHACALWCCAAAPASTPRGVGRLAGNRATHVTPADWHVAPLTFACWCTSARGALLHAHAHACSWPLAVENSADEPTLIADFLESVPT